MRAHGLTLIWAAAMSVAFNPKKSVVIGYVELHVEGKVLQKKETLKLLGDHLAFCGKKRDEEGKH